MRPSPVLALEALVDEVLIAIFHHPDLVPADSDFAPAGEDVTRAHELFAAQGWLTDPASYHESPPSPDDERARHARVPGIGFDHFSFTSGYEPHAGEPGRERWLSHEANRTVHAWVSPAPGRAHRTWLVCVPGFGMGTHAFVDLRAFRTPALHGKGINVAIPVLPLHGLRSSGRVRGEDLMTIDMVDSLHGIAQAVWDVRRLIGWLRVSQRAERIGLIGYSFGALVASVVAAVEADLACVVAGIPVVDLPEMFRQHSGPHVAELAEAHGVMGASADDVHRVVSPLAMPCRVPLERRYIFAGLGDRMSTFDQALRLWNHWDRPAMGAYQGGHVGFFWSMTARRLVDKAIETWLVP
jgi:pimeloyl-ACP methyl ester carboxylesterase